MKVSSLCVYLLVLIYYRYGSSRVLYNNKLLYISSLPPIERKIPLGKLHVQNHMTNNINNNEDPSAPIITGIKNPQVPKVEEGKLDIISRLLKDRIIFIGNQITDELAYTVVPQVLYLASIDSHQPIKIYINSPGGSVTAGMAIFDVIKHIDCDVETICLGSASSMAAFLLASGTPGKRKSFPNCRIMIHQPLGGAHGQATDIEIQAKEILFTKKLLNSYLSHFTGQPISKIEEDTDRNFFMTPAEALAYGLIDEIIHTKAPHVQVDPLPAHI